MRNKLPVGLRHVVSRCTSSFTEGEQAQNDAEQTARLRTVFRDVQQAIQDATTRHQVTFGELLAAFGWIENAVKSGDFMLAATILTGIPTMAASEGAAYTDSEKDGATPWLSEGPAYVEGAPAIENPGSLPMRPDEVGEILFISGTVRSTGGEPLAGAVVDVWQNDSQGRYGGLTAEAAWMVPLVSDSTAPKYNLRGKITTDEQGRYTYRTIRPGPEKLASDDSELAKLLEQLDIVNSRPLHLHCMVNADGHHRLVHQIHFDIDPMTDHASEGPLDPRIIFETELHEGPVPFGPQSPDGLYRTLTCDYVLRPV